MPRRSADSFPVETDTTTAADRWHGFKAGQPLTIEAIPFQLTAEVIKQVESWAAGTGTFRSLALSEDGQLYFVHGHGDYTSQEDANRVALEGCAVFSGGERCAIFAEKGFIKYDDTVFPFQLRFVLDQGARSLDISRLPIVPFNAKSRIGNDYAATRADFTYAALAFNATGAYMARGSNHSQQDADRLTLEACEAYFGGLHCLLYASGTNVVFNIVSIPRNPPSSLNFGTVLFVADKVPLASKSYLSLLTDYQQAAANTPAALVISDLAWFTWAIGTDIAAAKAQAMSQCKANIQPPGRCILYAEGLKVVWKSTDIERPEWQY